MTKILLIASVNFFCLFNSIGQDIKTEIVDINKDGFSDTVTYFYDGGSGYGGNYCSIINGKNGQVFELSTQSEVIFKWYYTLLVFA